MEKDKITFSSGTQIWKSHLEYFGETRFLHGFPYYRINKVNDEYYLWELDRKNPDAMKYDILRKSDDFDPLYEEGMKLQDDLRKQLYPDPDFGDFSPDS